MTSRLAPVRHLVGAGHGLATLAVRRPDRTVQATVVNVGVVDHPVTAEEVVGSVIFGGSKKRGYLRKDPEVTVTVRVGWEWVTVEGRADLIGPDDPFPGFDPAGLPQLLREVYWAAGGRHDDWEEYDRVMAEQRRLAVLVRPLLVYGNPYG